MRLVVAGALVCVLVIAWAPAAYAQDAPGIFIEGSGFADLEWRRQTETPVPVGDVTVEDAATAVAGGGVGVGTFLTRRVSLRVEAGFSGGRDSSRTFVRETAPFAAFTIVGSTRTELHTRGSSLAVMLGYHTDRRDGVRLAYLGGVVMHRERRRAAIESSVIAGPPFETLSVPPVRTETTGVDYAVGAGLGMEVDYALASHLSLLGAVRLHLFSGLVTAAPGVGLRWSP